MENRRKEYLSDLKKGPSFSPAARLNPSSLPPRVSAADARAGADLFPNLS
jgi:hypothetical protein